MTAPTPSVAAPGAPADGGNVAGSGTQASPPAAPAAPNVAGSGTQAPGTGQITNHQSISELPDWVQKIIKDARDEATKHRTDKQTATQAAAEAKSQRDAVLKALGLDDDGKEVVDPAKLTEQIDQYKAVAWENAVESHIVRLAATVGYDPDALLDSNQFLNSLEELVNEDPTGSDFRALLEKHLKDFVGKHPKFKSANGAPARSGGDMPPGQPGTPTARPTSLSAAVKKALGG